MGLGLGFGFGQGLGFGLGGQRFGRRWSRTECVLGLSETCLWKRLARRLAGRLSDVFKVLGGFQEVRDATIDQLASDLDLDARLGDWAHVELLEKWLLKLGKWLLKWDGRRGEQRQQNEVQTAQRWEPHYGHCS